MKLRSMFCAAAAFAVVLCAASLGRAQDDMMVDPMQAEPMQEESAQVDDYSKGGKGCYDDCCCDQSSWIFGAEVTFFKFHSANGVEDADAEDAEFDYEPNARLTLGYVGCDGLGARLRYWDYDENTVSVEDNLVSVDTYNVDFEVFQVVELGSCTCVDISAGIRYNEFDEVRTFEGEGLEIQLDSFSGVGGMFAIEAHRDLCGSFGLYARLREVIMMNDAIIDDNEENDVTRPITEIALGVSYSSCNWSVHAGYEWQNWGNYTGDANEDDLTMDVGFSGFVVGAEYAY